VKRGPIDWTAVRAGLDRARAASEALPTPEQTKAILDARARRLAERPRAPRSDELLQLATFALGDERYAIEMRFVREVGRLVEYARVPGVPKHILGVTNLRGELLLVIDPRRLLGLAERGLSDLGRLIVLGEERIELGLVADAALGMLDVPAREVLAAPDGLGGHGYLRGVTKDAWIVLDGRAFLADDRFVVDHRGGTS
jgi:purine-binding chemotaxis protein CheW